MKQKLFLLGMILLSTTFFSCDKEPVDPGPESSDTNSVIPVEDYCDGILDWVEETYPTTDITIDSVLLISYNGNNGTLDFFQVYLSNGAIATFSSPACQFISIDCNCSTDYEPVCWNDTPYDNPCLAECDGANPEDIFDGECECDCSDEPYDPVCWLNITYANACEAICDGANPLDIEDGDCNSCDCSDAEFDPVCWNDITYDNECEALCDGAIADDILPGECEDCDCSDAGIVPVCWNGTTYDNECEAICDGADPMDIVDGPCNNGTCANEVQALFSGLNITINSESDNGGGIYTFNVTVGNAPDQTLDVEFTYNCAFYSSCGCDSNVDFVCGNGTNYLNECEALCAGVDAADISSGWCQ